MRNGTSSRPGQSARGAALGAVIAGAFGAVFVSVNSGGLDSGSRIVLLVVAGALLLLILILVVRRRGDRAADDRPPVHEAAAAGARPATAAGSRPPFGRAYWLTVAVEAIALFGGTRALSAFGLPQLGVAWVAVVVGTHFFVLARIFGLARFHLLGAIVTACGLAGFALHLLGADGAIGPVSGVASGFALLGFGVWAVLPRRADMPGA